MECILRKRPLLKSRYCEQTEEDLEEDYLVYDVDEEFPLLLNEEPEEEPNAAPVVAPAPAPVEAVVSQPTATPAPKENLPLSPRAVQAKEVKEKWISKSKTVDKNKPQK